MTRDATPPRTAAPAISASTRGVPAFVERHFVLLLTATAALVLLLNWRALGQQGITPYLLDYRDIIRAGFDANAATRRGVPTFPMWGYGWVFLVTDWKLPLLVLQSALGIGALWLWVRAVARAGLLTRWPLAAYRLLLITATPWFVCHAVLWPSSFAAAFTLAALALVPAVYQREASCWRVIAASGLLLGLAANFRADALLLALGLAPLLLLCGRFRPRVWLRVGVWLLAAYGLMVPWAIYTHAVTGHVSLTSTNGGLTALTGFGHVPDNRWGITISDEDPVVTRMIEQGLGRKASPVSYAADRVLKAEFQRLVCLDPREYLRKVKVTLWVHMTAGVYAEFFRWLADDPQVALQRYRQYRAELWTGHVTRLWQEPVTALIMATQLVTVLVGVALLSASFCLLPVTLVGTLLSRAPLAAVSLFAIVYCAAVIAFLANADERFIAPVYPFHLLNVTLGVTWLLRWVGRNRPARIA